MPRPPQLERDVQFWIRVYTQVDTNSGFLHDEYNLGVVYETLHFAPNSSAAEREHVVETARVRIAAALKRIADAPEGSLTAEDQHIKDMWGAEGTPARLKNAIDDIRFQLGQSDRFRAGLIRSGAWETHIAETLANLGLPAELAVLPHVESSFNPAAYSKVGAAGLWQFMRSTGRRYMRIDGAVDDRLDPFRSTEAAAQLLAYNYRVLGTWPLALTAYNHGSAGVRRAKEQLGTDDIVKIVRSYTQPYLRLRLAQLLRLVPRRARHRPRPGEVLRPAAARERGALRGGVAAGLRLGVRARAHPEDRRRPAARAEPGAAAGGVERRTARAQGLSPAPAAGRRAVDQRAAGAAPGTGRAVRRPEGPEPLPRAAAATRSPGSPSATASPCRRSPASTACAPAPRSGPAAPSACRSRRPSPSPRPRRHRRRCRHRRARRRPPPLPPSPPWRHPRRAAR